MKQVKLETFRAPGSEYRGAPFWAWNGKLDPRELRRQIRLMHRMGLGGFFMHSRVGLQTPYLSDEWFACIDACIDEARRLGMRAWLYDEDRWPSGAAGGFVTRKKKYRMRCLALHVMGSTKKFHWDKGVLAAFVASLDGAGARHVRQVTRGKKPPRLRKSRVLLVFRVEVHKPNPWYNGYTYLDTLNAEAVARFIEVTHEEYRRRCGKHFGRTVRGIFTDEPNYGRVLPAGDETSLPWTDSLPRTFKKRYGYDIIDYLPCLFFDVEGRSIVPARYHYYDCVTDMFVEAFARQIGRWCDEHGLLHTGHVLHEETLSSQVHAVGSAMRFYEHMQAPGIDVLTEHSREYDTAKQASSVAHQFGRKWRLSEVYGCTGWDFPFVGHKAVGDWQAALGINLRCQHLAWYTMEGQAKRDYPAGIHYQSPWWESYRAVEDYFARVNVVLTQGEEVRDVLVLHPLESLWLLMRKGWQEDPAVQDFDRMLVRLRDTLLGANIDYDYGDESILARHASVDHSGDLPVIRVRKAAYRVVVVPPMLTLRASTVRLLREFRGIGGTVVFTGKPPRHVDAIESGDVIALSARCATVPPTGKKLVQAIEPVGRRVSITDQEGQEIGPVLYQLREDGDAFYLFVVNTGHGKRRLKPAKFDPTFARDRRHALPHVRIQGFPGCRGRPVEMNPETGELVQADAERCKAGWLIRTSLAGCGSRIFMVAKKGAVRPDRRRHPMRTVRTERLGGRTWCVQLSEENVLVLDRPRLRMRSEDWRDADDVLRADRTVREALDMPPRGGRMEQPWVRGEESRGRDIGIELEYEVNVRQVPHGPLFLAVERPDLYDILWNDKPLAADMESGWWCDRSLRRIPVDAFMLRKGGNSLRLSCRYDAAHPGLETIYLLGSFGVRVRETETSLVAFPGTLRIGDWTRQGLPFYSGSVGYHTTVRLERNRGERVVVQVPEYRGAGVRVVVDGRQAGIIGWEPNEVDITDSVKAGTADLCIEILGHRRNSHGPLHLSRKWPAWTGPTQFVTTGADWVDRYQLVPCGLLAPPRIAVRKTVRT